MVFSVYSCVSLLFVSRRPTTQKTFGPGRICNSKSGQIWPRPDLKKIISGATLTNSLKIINVLHIFNATAMLQFAHLHGGGRSLYSCMLLAASGQCPTEDRETKRPRPEIWSVHKSSHGHATATQCWYSACLVKCALTRT